VETREKIIAQVRTALERELPIDLRHYPLKFDLDTGGALIIEGETKNIGAKKLVLELSATVPGIAGIIDRLRVVRAQRMGDGQIRDHVRDALLGEPVFENCGLSVRLDTTWQTVREPYVAPLAPRPSIQVSVAEGVVTLDGQVGSLSHKCLAGALAWWVPGTRDVVNGLEVAPLQEEGDAGITEAVRLVLEKDPLVNAINIRVTTSNSVVTLDGVAANESEKEMAEMDAWCGFGVDRVINRLQLG
jgi:osmotically-inducible protein OsmY